MRRRRDWIGDRGSVIILKGWLENGFFRMLSDERALLASEAFGPGSWQGSIGASAKSLGRYDVWSGSATIPIPKPLLCFQAR